MTDTPLDYATAGVDTAAGDRAVELMKSAVAATHDSTVLGATGGFAGMVDASALLGMEKPLLATSTDGVGTKIAIAQAMDVHDTIGQDLVGMVVDDIVVIGARPVLMTDYIACGHVVPERIASMELLRLAVPRRVFTLSQTEYVIDRVKWLFDHRDLVGGLRFVHEPATLRFFTGVLEPIGDWPEKLAAAYRADFGDEQ